MQVYRSEVNAEDETNLYRMASRRDLSFGTTVLFEKDHPQSAETHFSVPFPSRLSFCAAVSQDMVLNTPSSVLSCP